MADRWETALDAAHEYAELVQDLYHDSSRNWVDEALFELVHAAYGLEVGDDEDPGESLLTFRWLLDAARYRMRFLSTADRLLAMHMLRH